MKFQIYSANADTRLINKRHGPKKSPKGDEKGWEAWQEETETTVFVRPGKKRRLEADFIIMFQYLKDGKR